MNLIQSFQFSISFFFYFPVWIILKNAGHGLLAHLLGYDVNFHYNSVGYQCDANSLDNLIIGFIGLLLPLLIASIAWFLLSQLVQKSGKYISLINFILLPVVSLCVFYPFRTLMAYMTLVFDIDQYVFTEQTLAMAIQLPRWSIFIALSCLSVFLVYKTLVAISPIVSWKALITGMIVGSTIGYFSWMKLLGPYIFP